MQETMSVTVIFPLCVCIIWWLLFSATLCSSYEAQNPEVEALISIKAALDDPHGVLGNWDENSVDPCSWSMITCSSDNHVTAIGAPNQGLSGSLSGLFTNLTTLRQLLLQSNNISGNIPHELGNLPQLQTVDLSSNKLSGIVPNSLGLLKNLQYLRLNNNSLSGPIPLSLGNAPQLTFLDLSYNNLSGPVPKFPTRAFNVVGNPLICGVHSDEKCYGYDYSDLSFTAISPRKSNSKRLAIALGFSLGFVALFLSATAVFIIRRIKTQRRSVLHINDLQEDDLVRLGNLKSFTFKELKQATDHFSSRNILGSGGFGYVYKGKLKDGTLVAVKRLKDVTGTAGEWQFRTEMELISLAVHRNLLRLIGYCAIPNERLLVYPYMSNGSVASRLKAKPALDWNTRTRIAIGASRGLLYLHEQCDPKIIHRDVKAANILLDDFHEAVVGDFGLAKLLDHGDSHVTTAVRGTVGHIAPEYLSTGQSSEKTDVFGFGILLLELITGMKALEFGKTINQKGAMLEWVKKAVEEKNIDVLVDKELGCNYERMEVWEMLQVAILCTQYLPGHRPKMSDVVRMLEGEGLAEKWASLNHNHCNKKATDFTTTKALSFQTTSSELRLVHQTTVPGHFNNDSSLVFDNSAMFDMITMDDDYDTFAMELSGPR